MTARDRQHVVEAEGGLGFAVSIGERARGSPVLVCVPRPRSCEAQGCWHCPAPTGYLLVPFAVLPPRGPCTAKGMRGRTQQEEEVPEPGARASIDPPRTDARIIRSTSWTSRRPLSR